MPAQKLHPFCTLSSCESINLGDLGHFLKAQLNFIPCDFDFLNRPRPPQLPRRGDLQLRLLRDDSLVGEREEARSRGQHSALVLHRHLDPTLPSRRMVRLR